MGSLTFVEYDFKRNRSSRRLWRMFPWKFKTSYDECCIMKTESNKRKGSSVLIYVSQSRIRIHRKEKTPLYANRLRTLAFALFCKSPLSLRQRRTFPPRIIFHFNTFISERFPLRNRHSGFQKILLEWHIFSYVRFRRIPISLRRVANENLCTLPSIEMCCNVQVLDKNTYYRVI